MDARHEFIYMEVWWAQDFTLTIPPEDDKKKKRSQTLLERSQIPLLIEVKGRQLRTVLEAWRRWSAYNSSGRGGGVDILEFSMLHGIRRTQGFKLEGGDCGHRLPEEKSEPSDEKDVLLYGPGGDVGGSNFFSGGSGDTARLK